MECYDAMLDRFWASVFAESTTEKVTARRRAVKQLLECIRAGTASREESEILRSHLQGILDHIHSTEDRRQMAALVLYYLTTEPMTARELGRKLNVDTRTIYHDLRRAIERLTIAIYGIDGIILEKQRTEAIQLPPSIR